MKKRETRRLKRALEYSNPQVNRRKRRKLDTSLPDEDYGLQCVVLDVEDSELEKRCQELISKLRDEVNTAEKRDNLERNTVGQHENELWR